MNEYLNGDETRDLVTSLRTARTRLRALRTDMRDVADRLDRLAENIRGEQINATVRDEAAYAYQLAADEIRDALGEGP